MSNAKKFLTAAIMIIAFGFSSIVKADGVKVIIENMSPDNGTWLTPFWVGFHDGSFDVYDLNAAASEELEHMAEDGNAGPLSDSFSMSGAGNVQGVIMTGDTLPPFAPGETAEMTFTLDGNDPQNRFFSFCSMVIPSNDAFIGNDSPTAHQIYDNSGNFLGASFIIYGTEVLDAGTEVNDEIPMNTAFFGQTTPDTGVDENGVVHIHPGYMPPDSGGILADPMFANADFKQPGYEVARITIIRADIIVPGGNVSGVWDGYYLIEGDVTVPAGETLTIEPGTTVYTEAGNSITVLGDLQAVGTENDSILFTGDQSGWRGIRFENANPTSHLEFCTVEYGDQLSTYSSGGGIYCVGSSLELRHCTVTNNVADLNGAGIYCSSSNLLVDDCELSNNNMDGTGPSKGGGIYCDSSTVEITNSQIFDNRLTPFQYFGATTARGGGIYLENTGGLVANNVIYGNYCSHSGTEAVSEGGGIYVYGGGAVLRGNTIVDNEVHYNNHHGGGVYLGDYDVSLIDNIIAYNIGSGVWFGPGGGHLVSHDDFYANSEGAADGGYVPARFGELVQTNLNGDSCDAFFDIFLDPLFVAPQLSDYHLTAGSPAIDAGDPLSSYDLDGTIADIGAFYYDQGGMPMVDVTLTPANPSIQIPASGGSFEYSASITNNTTSVLNFNVWIMAQLPDGNLYGPLLEADIALNAGMTLTRMRTQSVPASALQGVYIYAARVGNYPDVIWDQNSFIFNKSFFGEATAVNGWANQGEPFDQWPTSSQQDAPLEFALQGAYPNPFNPTTTISYALPEAARVSLIVYDVNGRTVATLVNGYRDAGVHEVTFDASSLASGVYVYRLSAGQFSAVGKMVLMK